MTKKEKREAQLLDLLHQYGKLSIKEIAENFNISEPTARRISAALAEKNKVVRTHGGIRYLPDSEFKYSFDILKNKFIEEKRRIAQQASTLIHNNDIIFLEAGTTIQQLAIVLSDKFRSNTLKNVKVFTNSLDCLNILSSLCEVTLIGGVYNPERKAFAGYISEKVIKYLSFKYCFLGADAINISEGIMASDVDTVRFDELLIKRANETIILADSSKFNLTSFVSYASLNEISMLITDTGISNDIKEEYQRRVSKMTIV